MTNVLYEATTVPAHGQFDFPRVLNGLKHYLPAQSALKDFIHHNSLHAYQRDKFYPAVFKASAIFGYQVTLRLEEYRQLYHNGRIREDILNSTLKEQKGGDALLWKNKLISEHWDTARHPRIGALRTHWATHFKMNLDERVHPLLFRIVGNYLDQGIALWKYPANEKGLLATVIDLEKNGWVSFFNHRKVRQLLLDGPPPVEELLEKIVGKSVYFEQYLFDQQFSHPGWSGFVASVEDKPDALLDRRKISLTDFITLELLLEMDALETALGAGWPPLCSKVSTPPVALFETAQTDELQEVLALWQDAFEWSYYDEVLAGIQQATLKTSDEAAPVQKSFQAVFCIDERECSLRRHIEQVDPACETLGTPGFFGVEFYFRPGNGQFYEKLCPAPVTPKYLIKELGEPAHRSKEWLYAAGTNTLGRGFLSSLTLGFVAGGRMALDLFRPKMSPAISNAFAHCNDSAPLSVENQHPDDRENGLQIGFTVTEMADRVEAQLRNMGMLRHFAPLVYVVAHGSSSANNPHHGAHDCGACSGRPGSVNARVLATMANHPQVRELLAQREIFIPAETCFLGCMHDTAADEIRFFDEHILTGEHQKRHDRNKKVFETALDLNAKERSRRFVSINTRQRIDRIRQAIKNRSVSLFEPRPELGHGTNSLCIVGNRDLTKNVLLDRRAFLNSYDYRTDPDGGLLAGVMRPLGPVCGGINLEYYFSRVDNYRLGAGTKLPHHVMGLFGVANSCDGDLRPGLPLQMIEVHDPVRLLIVVEHYPDVVLKTIQNEPAMYEWYANEWIHLIAVHPEKRIFFRFKNGTFDPYSPLKQRISLAPDFHQLIESWQKMPTNETADATRENLPVYSLT